MFHDQSADLPMPSSDAAYSLPIQLAAKLRAGRRCSPAAAAAASRRGTHGTSMCVAPTATGSDSHKFSQLSLTQPSRYAALSSAASPSDHCSRSTLCSDPNEAVDIPALHALQPIDRAPGASASLFQSARANPFSTKVFPLNFQPMPSSHSTRFENASDSTASSLLPQSREWDYRSAVVHPISAAPAPLPGNGFVRARARVPTPRHAKQWVAAEPGLHLSEKLHPSLHSLNLLTPSKDPVLPPRAKARSPLSPSRSISPPATPDWDRKTTVVQPIGSPASPLPDVAPPRAAVSLALWKLLAGHQDFLTSHAFHSCMRKLFPAEKHITLQELWVTMARSLSGAVSQPQFQVFFESSRPDFLFDQAKRYRQLLLYLRPTSASSEPARSLKHASELAGGSVSPSLEDARQDDRSGHVTQAAAAPGDAEDSSGPVTPADACARSRELLLQNAGLAMLPQVYERMGFQPVVLSASRATTPSHIKPSRDRASSPKDSKAAREVARLEQYLSWMRSVLPSEDHACIGANGSGLCNGLLLFKLIKLLGAPADRLHALHLRMDQNGRTRRLWLRNMEAIGDCALACCSSVHVLEPELAVDGDPAALVALLRVIVQAFVVKRIPKTRVIDWCAAHLTFFNITLQPQTLRFPHSNASLQHDFCDGVLISLLLQRCIPAAEEAVRSEAMLLLHESEQNSAVYSNRHIAAALVITLGLVPYFNVQQLELKPVEHNFLWMQLHAIYLAFCSSLPAPAVTVAANGPSSSRKAHNQDANRSITTELRTSASPKRVAEAKAAELQQSTQRLDDMKRTLRAVNSPKSLNLNEMIQRAKDTQAQLQERSEQIVGASSELHSVKQTLAAVMQQQQEVQSLVQEHAALSAAEGSQGGSHPALSYESVIEKVQRATLLEACYTHRAQLLRAAADEFIPVADQVTLRGHQSPEMRESIEKAQKDLSEMEQFFLKHSSSEPSMASKMLIDAKRSQLQELVTRGGSVLQTDDVEHIQALLSTDRSLQEALDHEAHVNHELEQLRQATGIEDRHLQKRQQLNNVGKGASSSKAAASRSRSDRSSNRVQFADAKEGGDHLGTDLDLQLRVHTAELIAIQRLIQSKQTAGDDKAVRALKHIMHRKQMRVLSLSPPNPVVSSQIHNDHSALYEGSDAECYCLTITNGIEGSSGATDSLAWRKFWQHLHVQFSLDLVCEACEGSDTGNGLSAVSVTNAMAQIADAMQKSRAQHKFLFLFITCPIAVSEPTALLLQNNQRLSFDYVHRWMGTLSKHDCLLVFDTNGNAFAQSALDSSRIDGFSGSIVCGCMGLTRAGVKCTPAHPLRCNIGREMGTLSFTIIDALLSAKSNLTCDQLEQHFSSIEMQEHIEPSLSSTLPVVVPAWIMNDRLFQNGRLTSNHKAQTRAAAHRFLNNTHSTNSASLSQDVGITSVRQTLETQYPPVSPRETEGSPLVFSPHIEPGVRHALAALSDDDDVTPSAAWQI